MKKAYRIGITGDRYPTEYIVEASGWATAVARAIREWKKRFKGSKTDKLIIRAFKGHAVLRSEKQDDDAENE